MNQLKVTGMLSSPCCPLGQPTALSVPHEALRIRGWGRGSAPVALATAGSAHTSTIAARDAMVAQRRCLGVTAGQK